MKRSLLVGIILLSLIGLTVVQFRLLVIGTKLEKQRFDQKVNSVLREMKYNLDFNSELGDSLSKVFNITPDYYLTEKESLIKYAQDGVQDSLTLYLNRQGIKTDFSYTFTKLKASKPLFSSKNFNTSEFDDTQYRIALGVQFSRACDCNLVLHLNIDNLFTYLLGELNYLLIPSVLFVLAILISVIALIFILKKEQQLNAVKNEFINNLTHELKTPVFSISLSLKIIKEKFEKGFSGKIGHLLKLIEQENEKLKVRIEKVLELASLENAKYVLNKEKQDAHKLLEESANSYKIKVEESGGKIEITLNAMQSQIFCDSTHLKNVFQNLLENAVKYSAEKIEIEVSTLNENKQLVIIFKDAGIGIASEYQKQIFQKFYRVPSGNLHPVKGFGLGLHYVKKIVEAHQGTIDVKSKKEKGTTFKISIPLA